MSFRESPNTDQNLIDDPYRLSAYQFELPQELIAQYPLENRDGSRLLVVDRKRETLTHARFQDLPEFLKKGDLLVANNTKVMKARLLGRRVLDSLNEKGNEKGFERISEKEAENPVASIAEKRLGGRVEFLLLEEKENLVWEGLFQAAAKQRRGVRFWIPTPDGKGLNGELIQGASESPTGTVIARFDRDPLECEAGRIPLPPYVERGPMSPGYPDYPGFPGFPGFNDEERYQTFYAKVAGSAAAPTAGLHFTEALHDQLKSKGISWEELTLHVGLGTFRPVKVEDIRSHKMHEERYMIPHSLAEKITSQKRSGQRVIAIGTTVARTLESAWEDSEVSEGKISKLNGRTSLFIYPGYRFEGVDAMITNFHLPGSTLLMLVSAFGGRDLILHAYREAVRNRYRFFSYGDAMLIL